MSAFAADDNALFCCAPKSARKEALRLGGPLGLVLAETATCPLKRLPSWESLRCSLKPGEGAYSGRRRDAVAQAAAARAARSSAAAAGAASSEVRAVVRAADVLAAGVAAPEARTGEAVALSVPEALPPEALSEALSPEPEPLPPESSSAWAATMVNFAEGLLPS